MRAAVRWAQRALLVSILATYGALVCSAGILAAAQEGGRVVIAEARGIITPTMASYLDRVITEAEEARSQLVIIALDTPGGLDYATRDIAQRILRARIPVALFVYPQGGRAGSAGVYITYSAHIAAMAPSTNIGSAHPIALEEGPSDPIAAEKARNDAVAFIRSLAETRGRNPDWAELAVKESANLPATEALRLRVVDLMADDVPDLLRQLDGRTVRTAAGEVRLSTRGAPLEPYSMNLVERLFQAISDPTVAYLLLSLGGLALVYELGNPGAILPGVVGGIALLLAFYALGTLPLNVAAVGLVGFALLLLLVDLIIGGSGILTFGGIASFSLGSLLFATAPESQGYLRVAAPAAIAMTLTIAVAFTALSVVVIGFRRRHRPVFQSPAALVGATGTAKTAVGANGTVLVEGEMWTASSLDQKKPIPEGKRVRVVAVDGLHLTVRPD